MVQQTKESLKMVMKYFRAWLVLFAAFLCSNAYGVTATATGKVDRIYTYSTGMVLVTGFTFPGATCSNNGGFFIAGNHPSLDTYLGIILSAKAMQSEMTVVAKINDCWYPTITSGGETTYFFMK